MKMGDLFYKQIFKQIKLKPNLCLTFKDSMIDWRYLSWIQILNISEIIKHEDEETREKSGDPRNSQSKFTLRRHYRVQICFLTRYTNGLNTVWIWVLPNLYLFLSKSLKNGHSTDIWQTDTDKKTDTVEYKKKKV